MTVTITTIYNHVHGLNGAYNPTRLPKESCSDRLSSLAVLVVVELVLLAVPKVHNVRVLLEVHDVHDVHDAPAVIDSSRQ